jgi:hypothetical protein
MSINILAGSKKQQRNVRIHLLVVLAGSFLLGIGGSRAGTSVTGSYGFLNTYYINRDSTAVSESTVPDPFKNAMAEIAVPGTNGRASESIISPNPNNGRFTITLPPEMARMTGSIEILSTSGRRIFTTYITPDCNGNIQLDVTRNKPGTYIMRAWGNKGTTSMQFTIRK